MLCLSIIALSTSTLLSTREETLPFLKTLSHFYRHRILLHWPAYKVEKPLFTVFSHGNFSFNYTLHNNGSGYVCMLCHFFDWHVEVKQIQGWIKSNCWSVIINCSLIIKKLDSSFIKRGLHFSKTSIRIRRMPLVVCQTKLQISMKVFFFS